MSASLPIKKGNEMALYSREEMTKRGKYDYSWTASVGDNPKIIGKPDSSRVSKKEGYEVLDLINTLAAKWKFEKSASARQLEDMIHKCDKIMRDEVIAWIDTNWDGFKV